MGCILVSGFKKLQNLLVRFSNVWSPLPVRRAEAGPGRGGRSLGSVALVQVLGVYNFDVSEGEEAPPPIHLPLPLAVDVHPSHLHDVADLGKHRKWAGLDKVTGQRE